MSPHSGQPKYPPDVQARFDRLPASAAWIFEKFLAALQNAEELGGPEGQEYIELMEAVIEEAASRRDTFREIMAAEDRDTP